MNENVSLKKRRVYFLDRQEDFFDARFLLSGSIETGAHYRDGKPITKFIDRHIALISAGRSKDQYKFNLSKVVCLWVNPRPDWADMVKRIYGEVWKDKHIACVSGMHPELIERFQEQNPDVDIFTFTNDRDNSVNAGGSFPAFLHYITDMLKYDQLVSCETWYHENRKMYICGCDMISEPGEYRNFESEKAAINKVVVDMEYSEWRRMSHLCQNYDDAIFPHNVFMVKSDNVLLYPDKGEVA